MSIEYDFSDLMKLAVDLREAPSDVAPNVRKAVQVTSQKIRDDWRKEAKRSGLAGYAAAVTYETQENRDGITSEIGPDLGRNQGSFGFVEDAGGGVRSAPQHAGRSAARKNEADLVKGIEKAIGEIL